jgi:hypothetical protein
MVTPKAIRAGPEIRNSVPIRERISSSRSARRILPVAGRWFRSDAKCSSRGGILSAISGLMLWTADCTSTPTSGSESSTRWPVVETADRWAARTAERTMARKGAVATRPPAVATMIGRNATRSGFSTSTALVSRSATKADTRGSSSAAAVRSAIASPFRIPRAASLDRAPAAVRIRPRARIGYANLPEEFLMGVVL